MERSSRVLQLQHGNPKIWFFFQKSLKFEFWLVLKCWNNLSFVNSYQSYISNWYINGKVFKSTTTWKHKNLTSKNSKLNFECFFLSSKLNFDLCRRAEVIRVGLNMHLCVDIGNASSSLRGSTSSFLMWKVRTVLHRQRHAANWPLAPASNDGKITFLPSTTVRVNGRGIAVFTLSAVCWLLSPAFGRRVKPP